MSSRPVPPSSKTTGRLSGIGGAADRGIWYIRDGFMGPGVSQHTRMRAPMAHLIIVETPPAILVARGRRAKSVHTSREDGAADLDSKPLKFRTAAVSGLSGRLGVMRRNRRSIAWHSRAAAPALLRLAAYQASLGEHCQVPRAVTNTSSQHLAPTPQERVESSGAASFGGHKCLI
jgi:hypothetical protein